MNRIQTSSLLAITGILAIVVFGAAKARVQQGQDPQPIRTQDEQTQLVEAMRRGGIHEAAKIKGSYVVTMSPHWEEIFADVESLTSHSDIVIVGMPNSGTSRVSSGGDSILTDYQVTVQQVLKGNHRQASSMIVSVLGGLVRFEDGTSAEVITPDFKIETGKTYIFFLSNEIETTGRFRITGGPQGVFEVPADGSGIIPKGRKIDHVVQKYKGRRLDSFLQEIHSAAEKWPDKAKCCQ
jgi:hypothetical protein